MPGLDVLYENDWSLGTFRSGAADLEPQGAAYALTGLLGDDGLPYRRGGSTYKSNAALGTAGLGWAWSGGLVGGLRTVYQSLETNARLAVLDSDDATPITLRTDASYPYLGPFRPAVVGGCGPFAVDASFGYFYAGSRKTGGAQTYSTGTATVTNGSASVVGIGTSWTANVDAGMIFDFNGAFPTPVKSIESNTALTLAWPYRGTTATGTYTARTFFARSLSSRIWAAVANRWVVAAGSQIDFSDVFDMNTWTPTNYHSFPAPVVGLGVIRDVLLVFTEAGVYAVSNMAYDLEDASGNVQQRREIVNADLIAWGHDGIAPWAGSLVVPALDGVWLVDSLGAPVKISQRIQDLYLGYVRTSGYKPGVAEVFNGHYLLPILTSANVWVDTLVCKLTPSNSGTTFAWSQLSGSGAQVTGFAERSSTPPLLLGASARSTSRVLDVSGYFNPSASVKQDADSTAHSFQLTTRNIPTGGQVTNSVLYIELFYSLTDAASDDPVFAAEYNADNAGWVALEGDAPEGGPDSPYVWPCSVAARHIRFRFSTSLSAASVKVEGLKCFVRKSGAYL